MEYGGWILDLAKYIFFFFFCTIALGQLLFLLHTCSAFLDSLMKGMEVWGLIKPF